MDLLIGLLSNPNIKGFIATYAATNILDKVGNALEIKVKNQSNGS